MSRSLAEWLAHQERLHPRSIALGLERVRAVQDRLGLAAPPFQVLTVAGTDGKGSCVAYLAAALHAAGLRTATYTSPHLERYTERLRIGGAELGEDAWCDAFARVEAARHGVPLTYFEYGTLGAAVAAAEAGVAVAVLEVGLGGRLDAVNAFEPLGAAITSVGLDHTDLLGPDRESIGREKAGVFRRARPAVCGEPDPPASIAAEALRVGAPLWQRGREFDFRRHADGTWDLVTPAGAMQALPPPALAGEFQYANAATALALLAGVAATLPVPRAALEAALTSVVHPGRLESLPGAVSQVLDVAHNPHAAAALAAHLAATRGAGRTLLVIAMYADKDAEGVVAALRGTVDEVHAAGLDGPRGQSGAALAARLAALGVGCRVHADVLAAHAAALTAARAGDRVVVCGSFASVGAVRARLLDSPAV